MSNQEAMKRAIRNLLRRIGPSTMPIEAAVQHGVVQAFDPETGSMVTYAITENRLTNARWCLKGVST